jgi:hemin uptake protein HemP
MMNHRSDVNPIKADSETASPIADEAKYVRAKLQSNIQVYAFDELALNETRLISTVGDTAYELIKTKTGKLLLNK